MNTCMNEGCEGEPGPHFSFETNGKLNTYQWCWPCWEQYVKSAFNMLLKDVG